MGFRKRFIEWDMPLAEVSEESAREKNIRHGHPSTLHIWWARRPLAASRATAFAALIDLPESREEREELRELIKKISPWEAVKNGDSKDIERARQLILDQWGRPPRVLDPFAGGGSITLEALRLGCETYANDLNPVAVFIEKATLEWPQKFGIEIPNPEQRGQQSIDGPRKVNFLVYMVEKWANRVLEDAKAEIGGFYPEDEGGWIPVGYIWARTIPCQNPTCGAEIPLVRQFWLAKKNNKKVAYKPVVDKENKRVDFVIQEGDEIDFDPSERTVSRANARCLVCGQVTKANLTRQLAREGKMRQRLVAVVLHHPEKTGKKYRIATKKDVEIYEEAEKDLQEKIRNWKWLDTPIPDEKITYDPANLWVVLYGFSEWGQLFNSRQKLALITFMEKIKESYEGVKEECKKMGLEEYGIDPEDAAKAVMGYLGIIFSYFITYNCKLARYRGDNSSIEHALDGQRLPMIWDYGEVNPIGRSRGDFGRLASQVLKVVDLLRENKTANCYNLSATSLLFPNNHFDAVITDPPYYDNIAYAYLSDFFYVWMKRTVGDLFPDIFTTPTTPKKDEIITDKFSSGKSKEFFENMLSESFKEIHRILKPSGIAVIIYAHKTTSGWETMLNSLVNAGLVVTASWPVHTEMKTRLRAAASAALASSIYMVCRKTEREEVGYWNEIQPRIRERIEEKLQQFWNEGIAGGDFFISAIGPAMEIYSQYKRVERYSGQPVATSELLDYIRTVSTNWIVHRLLKGASAGSIDNEAHFYLTYRWTYLDNTVPYDDARKLASASGVNLEEFWKPGGFVKKMGEKIKVLGPKERGDFKNLNGMVDVMHKALLLWEEGRRTELSELLATTGQGQNPSFWQFCQAIAESLLNGNKEKQLLEGMLTGKEAYMRESAETAQRSLEDYG